MSGSVLFHIAFGAVVVVIILTAWAAMVFEAGEDPPGRQPEIRGASHRVESVGRQRLAEQEPGEQAVAAPQRAGPVPRDTGAAVRGLGAGPPAVTVGARLRLRTCWPGGITAGGVGPGAG